MTLAEAIISTLMSSESLGIEVSLSRLYLLTAINSEMSFSYETFAYALRVLIEIGRVIQTENRYKLRPAEDMEARRGLEELGLL